MESRVADAPASSTEYAPEGARGPACEQGIKSSGQTPIIFSLVVPAAGLIAFPIWAKAERRWPFGPVHEEFA